MESVPVDVLDVFCQAHNVDAAALFGDVTTHSVSLSDVPEPLRQPVLRYVKLVNRFLANISADVEPGPWVNVERIAARHQFKQKRSVSNQGDSMGEVLEALATVPGVAAPIDRFLEPDAEPFSVVTHGLTIETTRTSNQGTFSAVATDIPVWPTILGGAVSTTELSRIVTAEASYAKWRDRKLRRLMGVTVTISEVWPDPCVMQTI